jgi:prepilin-type processing-associated H-X9-DG protein
MTNHKTVAMAAFADGHVGNINKSTTTGSGTNKVCAQDGSTTSWFADNKDAGGTTPDNIYDDNVDGGANGLLENGGSSSRAFVK